MGRARSFRVEALARADGSLVEVGMVDSRSTCSEMGGVVLCEACRGLGWVSGDDGFPRFCDRSFTSLMASAEQIAAAVLAGEGVTSRT